MNILIIEDEINIANAITDYLNDSGINSTKVSDSVLAEYELQHNTFDAIILDLGLPNIDGLQLLKRIKNINNNIPILVLTARDSIQSKLDSFKMGADDYMIKPFSLEELLARIHAIIRRYTKEIISPEIKIGKLRLNPTENCIYAGLEVLDLSVREYSVLSLLIHKKSKVVSKRQLQEFLTKQYSEDWITEAAIEVYIHRVRKKIEPFNVEITTIRGFGYLLKTVVNDRN